MSIGGEQFAKSFLPDGDGDGDGDSDSDGDGDGDNVKSGADNACLCRALNVSNNCFGNCRGCHAFFQ